MSLASVSEISKYHDAFIFEELEPSFPEIAATRVSSIVSAAGKIAPVEPNQDIVMNAPENYFFIFVRERPQAQKL